MNFFGNLGLLLYSCKTSAKLWIYRCIYIAASKNGTNLINVYTMNQPVRFASFSLSSSKKTHINKATAGDSWSNYVRGVFETLVQSQDFLVEGCDILIDSTLPQGQGLSSSAALENGILYAIMKLYDIHLVQGGSDLDERVEIARLSNMAENHYVGVGSGILDQSVGSTCKKDCFVVMDCKRNNPKFSKLIKSPMAQLNCGTVVINTATTRSLAEATMDGEASCEFERCFSIFNRRVLRYWIGVTLLSSICKENPNEIITENYSLSVSTKEIQDRFSRMPSKFIIKDITDAPGDVESIRETLRSSLDSSYKPTWQPGDSLIYIPVLGYHSRLHDDMCGCFVFLGCATIHAIQEIPWMTNYSIMETKICADLVLYMSREDSRVDLLSQTLDGTIKQDTKDAHQSRVLLGDFIQEHIQHLQEKLQHPWDPDLKVTRSLSVLSEKIAWETTLISRLQDCNMSLSSIDLLRIQGILGDLSWSDKRDLFRGDSAYSTLDLAYRYAELLDDISGEAFVFIGKIGAGAGWAGMAPVYISLGEDNKNVQILESLITGRLYGGDSNLPLLNPETKGSFVPYAKQEILISKSGMQPNRLEVWVTIPSEGLGLWTDS
eukprot:TRINITY_DN4583_c0_g1_i3.p1 TRINITY_DN4583_c0_g1~~TRINITY_DN4583_c0_g1_i3.p1  ORF type:complete len:606 (+),score=93.60 TRINITY_DN4583_c0_g1_i3:59-1876(+)